MEIFQGQENGLRRGTMIRIVKRCLPAIVLSLMLAVLISGADMAFASDNGAFSEPGNDTPCDHIKGSNENAQLLRGQTDESYLIKKENGYMKVQAGDDIKGFVVEYFDNNFTRTAKKSIQTELPIWGGFYEHNNYYYVCTGQYNGKESDQVEVYRITKFDKNWKRLASAGFYGENTYVPFESGNCRFAAVGDQLIVHTCHTMYDLGDGLHHQSNHTIQVDMNSMKAVDFSDRYRTPYSSHSFNQFIKKDGNGFVTLDHGDAYPRALMLSKTSLKEEDGKIVSDIHEPIYVMNFRGKAGDNETGASLGGLELSDSSYIIAGESLHQDDPHSRTTRNIFVAVIDRKSNDVNIKWITDYKEDSEYDGAGTPQLVKLNNNRFAILWAEDVDNVHFKRQTKCVFIDGKGNPSGRAVIIDAELSDCAPIVVGSELVWYVWNNERTVFYRMPLSAPANVKKIEKISGHTYKRTARKKQNITLKCSKCGIVKKGRVPAKEEYMIYWRDCKSKGFDYSDIEKAKKNHTYHYWVDCDDDKETIFNDFIVTVSDSSKAEISERTDNFSGEIKFKKAGSVKLTFYPRYMPEQKTVFTVKIKDPSLAKNNIKAADRKVTVSLKKKKYDLKASNRAGLPMKYRSNNSAVKVDSNGRITVKAKYIGKAVITITTPLTAKFGEAKRRITVKVLPPKTKMTSVKAGRRKISVKWKKQTKFVNGYQVQYALNKKFKKAKKVTVAGKKKSKATVKRLKSGKRYYVRVRTYKTVKGTKYYSLWSKTKAVKVR